MFYAPSIKVVVNLQKKSSSFGSQNCNFVKKTIRLYLRYMRFLLNTDRQLSNLVSFTLHLTITITITI